MDTCSGWNSPFRGTCCRGDRCMESCECGWVGGRAWGHGCGSFPWSGGSRSGRGGAACLTSSLGVSTGDSCPWLPCHSRGCVRTSEGHLGHCHAGGRGISGGD